ncbi:hypothetical protein O3W44_22440 [Pantoea sp. LMR881]|uniref:hypothetical protein n=1 Tax=Pantoea sp. LMR881 TaxID=3014336 RepID=UPI0022B044E6|nr:hypothetical protein [Pantoea sp. LMR881]MCZ4061182.1 hypothetical protein [Pantoea sp. LMR881]MCZ4061293.1 hypothetical protein [Pantoea sp. LMR881]
MIDKNQVKQAAKEHFINLKSSGAAAMLLSVLNAIFPTTDRNEKVRRLDLIMDVVATA